jgi:hypothetical protein
MSGQPGYAFVTDSATPMLVTADVPGNTGGTVNFTAYGTPLPIAAPSAADSIDGSALGF